MLNVETTDDDESRSASGRGSYPLNRGKKGQKQRNPKCSKSVSLVVYSLNDLFHVTDVKIIRKYSASKVTSLMNDIRF